jgi:hypothetical protein
LVIGQKLFEETVRTTGVTFKNTGPEGVTTELNASGEIKGFGKAQGVDGVIMGTMIDISSPSGMSTGTGQGMLMTKDGEMAVWKMTYSGKMIEGKQKWVGVMTFMTMSKKIGWLNNIVCASEGEGSPDPTKPGTNTIYEWIP